MMGEYNTLPSKGSYNIFRQSECNTVRRRDSVEIVSESDMGNFTRPSSFSFRARRKPGLTPSRAFNWHSRQKVAPSKNLPTSSSRYFHAVCYRASVTKQRKDLRLATMQWTKLNIVVFDDVILFFSLHILLLFIS